MTNEEYALERVKFIAETLKEWGTQNLEDAHLFKDHDQLHEWYKSRGEAYNFAADWLLQTLGIK